MSTSPRTCYSENRGLLTERLSSQGMGRMVEMPLVVMTFGTLYNTSNV